MPKIAIDLPSTEKFKDVRQLIGLDSLMTMGVSLFYRSDLFILHELGENNNKSSDAESWIQKRNRLKKFFGCSRILTFSVKRKTGRQESKVSTLCGLADDRLTYHTEATSSRFSPGKEINRSVT
jgi:hypothetical protein